MSEAAVAETETPTKESTPLIEAASPEATPSGAEKNQDAGAPAAEATQPTGTDGEEVGEPNPEALAQAAVTEALGGKPAAPQKAEDTAPGISLDQYQFERRQELAALNARARQDGEGFFKRTLTSKYGLSEADAADFWETAGRRWANDLISSNDAYQEQVDAWVVDQLPDSQKQAFKSRVYRGRKERTEGLIAIGKQEAEAAHQADIEAGKLLPRNIADKAALQAATAAIAARDKQYNARGLFLAKSGNEVNGTGGVGRSEDEILLDPTTPISTINEILARRSGQ